jgi:hypothetical protein
MKNTFILLGLLIFLIYIYFNPKSYKPKSYKPIENFIGINKNIGSGKNIGNNKGIDAVHNIFKKNFDLDYYDTRDPKKLSELKKMFTNKLAPLIQKEFKNNPAKTKEVIKQINSRIPNKIKNNSEYIIPMPKFNNLQGDLLKPLIKSFKQIKNLNANRNIDYKPIRNADNVRLKKSKKKETKKELFNNNNSKITERNISGNLKCKFVTSFKSTNKCPANYPIYTGATVSGIGSNLSCNGQNVKGKRATGIAIIKNGQIKGIRILNAGSQYSKVPKIFIRGIGQGARAKATIKNGKITNINLVNGGKGYISTPSIIIEKPQVNIHCNLCCKK